MAVGKKTGGRKKGTPNKKTSTIQEKLDALDCDPIIAMVKLAKEAHQGGDLPLAGSMYKELAQYVYPKRKAVELTGKDGGDIGIDAGFTITVIDPSAD